MNSEGMDWRQSLHRRNKAHDWRMNMGEVIKFVSRAELERMRLARESRTRSGSIVSSAASLGEPRIQKSELADS